MRNRMYGGVRGRKTKVGEKLLRFPPTRFYCVNCAMIEDSIVLQVCLFVMLLAFLLIK